MAGEDDVLHLMEPLPPQQTIPFDFDPPGGANIGVHAAALAEAILSHAFAHLRAAAQAPGAVVSPNALERLLAQAQGLEVEMTPAIEDALAGLVEARKSIDQQKQFDKVRQFPFDRVIVKTFSHLFADEATIARGGAALSRRLLPGFFMALGMMVGPEVLEEYQEKSRRTVQRLKDRLDDDFNWNAVYSDPNVTPLILDAQVKMALHFEDLAKRRHWFIELVNANLAKADPNRGEGKFSAAWVMTPPSFHALMDGLFADLAKQLGNVEGRTDLMMDYGKEVTDRLIKVLGSALIND
ncbi:MAG: hypothetical protein ACPGNT_06090 [Rhodospirillales bacterium]